MIIKETLLKKYYKTTVNNPEFLAENASTENYQNAIGGEKEKKEKDAKRNAEKRKAIKKEKEAKKQKMLSHSEDLSRDVSNLVNGKEKQDEIMEILAEPQVNSDQTGHQSTSTAIANDSFEVVAVSYRDILGERFGELANLDVHQQCVL